MREWLPTFRQKPPGNRVLRGGLSSREYPKVYNDMLMGRSFYRRCQRACRGSASVGASLTWGSRLHLARQLDQISHPLASCTASARNRPIPAVCEASGHWVAGAAMPDEKTQLSRAMASSICLAARRSLSLDMDAILRLARAGNFAHFPPGRSPRRGFWCN